MTTGRSEAVAKCSGVDRGVVRIGGCDGTLDCRPACNPRSIQDTDVRTLQRLEAVGRGQRRVFWDRCVDFSMRWSLAASRSGAPRAVCVALLASADLDLVVPHQANGRLIEAMRLRLALAPERVWNEIRLRGNTSSSSMPLALDTVLRRDTPRSVSACAPSAPGSHLAAQCWTATVAHQRQRWFRPSLCHATLHHAGPH